MTIDAEAMRRRALIADMARRFQTAFDALIGPDGEPIPGARTRARRLAGLARRLGFELVPGERS